MRINDLLLEGSTTLQQLYRGGYPDRDEIFWDYVGSSELDIPLDIQLIPGYKLKILLNSQYRTEDIYEILDMLDSDQEEIVDRYRGDPGLSDRIIVLSGDRIIDGNHRALAAALNGSSIRYIDLQDLDGE
jgi:hypothetical protein